MGGNAHPDYTPVHLTNSQRDAVITTLTASFADLKFFSHFISPRPASEKTSHGDVDFLAVLGPCSPPGGLSPARFLRAGLSDDRNGSYIYHLDKKTVQVDISIVSATFFPLELFMRSYGDPGAIVGAYARKLGYKLSSSKGFQYVYPEALPRSGKKCMYSITNDPREVCETYLGLKYEQWQHGFEIEEDLFEWLRPACPYFGEQESRGEITGASPMYCRFGAWCVEQKQAGGAKLQLDATCRLRELGKHAEMQKLFEAEVETDEFNHAFRAVFNASAVVADVEGRYGVVLRGKALGAFMQRARQHLPKTTLPSLVDVQTAISTAWTEKLDA